MCNTNRTVDILSVHMAREAIFSVISALNYFSLRFKLCDDTNRPEDFLAHNPHVWLHIGEDRWPNEVSGAVASCTASDHTGTLLNAMLNVAKHALTEKVRLKPIYVREKQIHTSSCVLETTGP